MDVIKRIQKLKNITDSSLLRFELYAIITTILLSFDMFKRNKDISSLLDELDISFKDYVMESRTNILARVLRLVEKAEDSTLSRYKDVLLKRYAQQSPLESPSANSAVVENGKDVQRKQKKQKNYMGELLDRYSRNKD